MDIEGFILVGGASRRMGRDKARLLLNGRSFVERISHALGRVTKNVSFVGARGADSYAWEKPFVPDVHETWGALGGLHAALAACRAEWAAVVACDLPFVTGELFERLASLSRGFDAVVPLQPDGRLQPLCALYRAGGCLARAEELIASGERRPRALVDAVRARKVEPAELADLRGARFFFTNVNTPEDLKSAEAVVLENARSPL